MRKSGNTLPVLFCLLGGFMVLFLLLVERKTVRFQESDGYVIGPDRGIYMQVETDHADRIPQLAALEGKERLRLLLLAFDISEFSESQQLSNEKLQELDSALTVAETENFSVIFRAAYGFGGSCQEPENISWIENHIGQIAQVLSRHGDSVLCVQAGMLGPYGEWHSSTYTADGNYNAETHRIVTAWLKRLLETVEVALRRPSFVRAAISLGADEKRLTVHNDALFSNETDMGTYHERDFSRKEELSWLGERTAIYMGGETTGCSDYSAGADAIAEMDEMHLQYLNRYYNRDVWQQWRGEEYCDQRVEDYILQHLGYRLVVEELSTVRVGKITWFQMRIRNTGFGKLDGRVKFYLAGDGTVRAIKNHSRQENVYIFQGFLQQSEVKNGSLGLCITRRDFFNTDQSNCIQLATAGVQFENGINRIPTP